MNFQNFWLDTVEQQIIIKVSCYESKRVSPEAGWKNPTGQELGSHSSLRKLLILSNKSGINIWDKIQLLKYDSPSTTPGEHLTEQKQNRNRIRIGEKTNNMFSLSANILLKILFAFPLHLPLSTSTPQIQPSHHNVDNFLWHHSIVNIFSRKTSHAKTPFHTNPSQLLSDQLPKIYLYFQTKIFNETGYIWL